MRPRRAVPPADLNFRSKRRPCGKCGREFRTSPKWRYHCASVQEQDPGAQSI